VIKIVIRAAKICLRTLLLGSLLPPAPWAVAQSAQNSPRTLDLSGVYESLPSGRTLPGGYKNVGSPADVQLLPFTSARENNSGQQEEDAFKLCQAVGPFRMMAMEETKIELVPAPGTLVMLFEDISHGNLRTFYLNRRHLKNLKPTLQGDSVAHWERDTLVIDTIGLSEQSWLNDTGAHASEALHLVERIRPLQSGRILEYKVRAEDPKALARPYSYTRYYERLNSEIQEDVCEIDSHWDCGNLCLK
jgi:hypothetical protein